MTDFSLQNVADLLDAVDGAPGDFQYMATAAGHLKSCQPCLLLLADARGNVIAADDFSSGIGADVAGPLALEMAQRLQTESSWQSEVATNVGPRIALAVRITDDHQRKILGCLIRPIEPAQNGLEHLSTALTACSVFASAAILNRADYAKLSRRVEHLQAEHEMLDISHAEAVAAMLEERERRRQQQQQKAALEELVQATKAANHAKSRFLANASHELRTPLTAILGYTDLAMDLKLSDERRSQHLEIIHRNGRLLLELINDILDLSKIEAGKLAMKRAECSPCRLVEDLVSLMQVQAEEKGIRLEVDYRLPIPEVIHTDQVRLRQILMNLVGNAIKFTERGGVRVSVGFAQQDDMPARMQFAVADTGKGIPSQAIPQLFSPFTQVDDEASREFGGTGLGLAISDRLAEMLGGFITVDSTLGEGSTFTVSIDPGSLEGVPMIDRAPEAPTKPQAPATVDLNANLAGRVLLAEDGQDNQRLIGAILRKVGLEIDLAENGLIACERAAASTVEGNPYDLILMDMQMPRMDGYEATRRLRQSGWRGPIVALTANAMAGDREKCLQAGCDDYLTKPIERTTFLSAVGRFVTRAPAAEPKT